MPDTKILLGIPTYPGHAYCRAPFLESLAALADPAEVDVLVAWNGEQREPAVDAWPVVDDAPAAGDTGAAILCRKQNTLRQHCLSGNYSHLLLLESDIIAPADLVARLVAHRQPVVSGLYFLRVTEERVLPLDPEHREKLAARGHPGIEQALVVRQQAVPCAYGRFSSPDGDPDAVRLWSLDDWLRQRLAGRRLVPVVSAGLGCCLIAREVLESVPFRIDTAHKRFSDFFFYADLHTAGIPAALDIELIARHRSREQNRAHHFQTWYQARNLPGK
ncbi:MAG: hypothetical protein LJE84_00380 [Gammaproteobacteria bacterium]|nr:hypothetical protein [Gammaproteobacteria bacterium]